ncbi:DUF4376 domain-containing protein [Stutzerimonas stutzeri]|uniref:DUF4376 domain-containing protein n=1 Tax=Stutzerimonas stutzeri TaxID=316 RepID=UPI00210B24B5|nr:DUF4376 domain-containing protein [Stutzerimonas stutzeri]MCQ4257482.1 DUF4376 domain-containing protein [Stutzerimonas stutzeri]
MKIDFSQVITAEHKAQQAAVAARESWKGKRAAAVERIKVTTTSGREFDGDEASQGRMARAILGLQEAGEGETVTWVLADNTPVAVTAAELGEALKLAGAEQARLWVADHE